MRFIGIDIASEKHFAAGVSAEDQVLFKATPFTEDAEGYAKLVSLLGKPDDALVVMEATGHYWRNLFATLAAHGFSVALLNPLRTRRFAEEDLARTKTDLVQIRPRGGDPAIVDDLPNEYGIPNHNPGTGIVDNHNVLTGSKTNGTLDAQGLTATCQDWTNKMANGGRPRCGVSWPRVQLTNWMVDGLIQQKVGFNLNDVERRDTDPAHQRAHCDTERQGRGHHADLIRCDAQSRLVDHQGDATGYDGRGVDVRRHTRDHANPPWVRPAADHLQ